MYNPLPANNGGAGETLTVRVCVCVDRTCKVHAACRHAAARPALLLRCVCNQVTAGGLISDPHPPTHPSTHPPTPATSVVCSCLQVYDVDVEFVMLDGQIVAQDIDGDADDK